MSNSRAVKVLFFNVPQAVVVDGQAIHVGIEPLTQEFGEKMKFWASLVRKKFGSEVIDVRLVPIRDTALVRLVIQTPASADGAVSTLWEEDGELEKAARTINAKSKDSKTALRRLVKKMK